MVKDSDSEESSRDAHKRHRRRRSRSDSSEKSSSSSSVRRTMHKKHKSRRSSKSRSRSRSKERSSKSSRHRSRKSRSPPSQARRSRQKSRSRSREKKLDKIVSKPGENSANALITSDMSAEEQLRVKMQMALKAAAEADAQLRQKGILPPGGKKPDLNSKDKLPSAKAEERTVQEQFYRAQAIDSINAAGFEPQAFISDRSLPRAKNATSHPDDHSAVIFGSNLESKAVENRVKLTPNAVLDQLMKDQLIHENLFADMAAKQERWVRKLYNMRQKRLNGEIMS